jgi:hypothetical protein
MNVYELQLQRNRVLVERIGPMTCSANVAVRKYRTLLSQCRGDGMVVILCDGQELAPHELRDEVKGDRYWDEHG